MTNPARRLSWLGLAGAMLVLFLVCSPRADAFSCAATTPGAVAFTGVSPVSGLSYQASSTFQVTCTVFPLEGLFSGTIVRVCLSISGAAGVTPRTMVSGGNSLQYNLYSDSGHMQVWGSAVSGTPGPLSLDFPLGLLGILLGGSSTQNVTIYGLIPAGQTTVPAATNYAQAFAGAGASLNYVGYNGTAPTCSSSWTTGTGFPFSATAVVINDCNISATDITFDPAGVLTSALTKSGTIGAQCTAGDTFSIALDGGTTAGATIADRQMVLAGGGAVVHYEIYTDGTYSTIWGNGAASTGVVGATATGALQNFTVFAKVAPQTTPKPGSYSDMITATITF